MDLELKGAFAWSTTYNEAPNPALRVDGLGTMGMPLGDCLAASIIQFCATEPQADANVLTLDATRVHFDNPAWTAWIVDVQGTVFRALRTSDTGAGARAILRSVVLRRSGARLLSAVPNVNGGQGTFGTMVVTLPAHFVGGSSVLTHQRDTLRVDISKSSLLCTSVVAWYRGVGLESEPITSGYSFALLYDLVSPPEFALAAPTEPFAVTKLRRVLLSWKQREDGAKPEKILLVLKDDYRRTYAVLTSEPWISSARLTGHDALVFRVLDGLAKELGFCLGLCTLLHTVTGTCAAVRRRRSWHDALDEESYTEMIPGTEKVKSAFIDFVDADGKEIMEELDWAEHEIIPAQWKKDLKDSDDFDRERTSKDCIEFTYVRTAIVVWPKSGTFANGLGNRA
ncbi:hypothetical protein EXIGLDRAFT_658783 [Exidia glandulosa HHB12029]|uniref:Uncharacterized protein n=1 Tax=Exidia glandulosa HHB12029 TaxID=1314781 RepID=A0A165BQ68_EXIGL|nr:hypothetical protein EXIGLDRAFT_658783 [Exidia glandulosa HHB12029]